MLKIRDINVYSMYVRNWNASEYCILYTSLQQMYKSYIFVNNIDFFILLTFILFKYMYII